MCGGYGKKEGRSKLKFLLQLGVVFDSEEVVSYWRL